MTAVIQVFPTSVDSMITSIVNQVYNQSSGIIPITVVVALWSAGKGVLAMTSGLNCVYKCNETRNYIFLRIRATIYTVMFILVIIFLLVLSVFGNTLNIFIAAHVPILKNLADRLIAMRTIITPIVLMVFCLLIYKFLPNRKDKAAQAAARGGICGHWMDDRILDIFCIRRYIQRVFRYVWKPYHYRAHHAVDVFLHVLHIAWRGTEYDDV